MVPEHGTNSAGETDRTARTVGQLVKYSRAVNTADTVGEVGSYALEAAVHVMDGHPVPTVYEVARNDVTVLETMAPGLATGDAAGPVATRALADDRTVIVADEDSVAYASDDAVVVPPADVDGVGADAVAIAAPSVFVEEPGDVGVVLLVQWDALDAVAEYHVKPVEYLADHLATALANVRSRERLERARNDLARRKEMIEMYDRLLRHDLGNDLQIVSGYADALLDVVEGDDDRVDDGDDERVVDYATTIHRTAASAADLVDRVGDLVKTLETEASPEVCELEPILSSAVEDVEAKFPTLTVEYDPADFAVDIYAGDLLDSIFANILSNAAAHNDGDVTVAVYAAESRAGAFAVGFADDGTGVDADVRDDLFEMGMKGPDSDGDGFGLGFVRALAESYGGTVAVGDSHLGGAEFRVELDRA